VVAAVWKLEPMEACVSPNHVIFTFSNDRRYNGNLSVATGTSSMAEMHSEHWRRVGMKLKKTSSRSLELVLIGNSDTWQG
jgi:hypothetical protein